MRVDASCVAGPVDRYDWILDVGNQWQRVDVPNGGTSFVQDWSGDCGESNKTIEFRLTVHRGADSDSSSKSIVVPGEDLQATPNERARRVRFESHLAVAPFDGSARGRIVINGTVSRIVDSSQPELVESPAVGGANRLVASLTRAASEPGQWRFDFRSDPSFVPGSLRVVHGSVVTLGAHAVVLRLSGEPGERIELTFELRR